MDAARPYSTPYAEHYWGTGNAVTEKYGVFIEGNQLPARFAQLQAGADFRIGELGFGTGLSACLAAQSFMQHAPAQARLHIFSTEAHPLALAEVVAIQQHFPPALGAFTKRIQELWPTLQVGWNEVPLGPRVTLQLYAGEALQAFEHWPGPTDAWFLDGFSPAKNPAMWSRPLMQALAIHSAPHATVATYSAATMVRENLGAAGFEVQKVKGIPPKRKMLVGRLRPEG